MFVRFRDGVVSNFYFPNYEEAKIDFDRLYLSDLLKRNESNKSRSSKEAGFSRFGLDKKLKRTSIEIEPTIFEWNDSYSYHAPRYEDVLRHFEVVYIHHLMVRSQGSSITASKIAGMSRFGIFKYFKKYNLPLEDYR